MKYNMFLPKEITKNMKEEILLWKKEIYVGLTESFMNKKWEELTRTLKYLKKYQEINYPFSLEEKSELCKGLYEIIIYENIDFTIQIQAANAIISLIK
jgi:hypothetical protein